jgi:hypothetical protein
MNHLAHIQPKIIRVSVNLIVMNKRDFNCADADAPIIVCPQLLIHYIRIHLSFGGHLLHPQREDAP